jgi:hypothetical protein
MRIPLFFALSLAPFLALSESKTSSARIDELVETQLKKQGLEANAEISDAVFLRRVYLDIAGRIPTIEEAEKFHGETYENKRERLIDQLLESEGYVSDSYHLWADLLRINGEPGGTVSDAYELWVKEALRRNLPYDEFVRSLVTATGKFWDNGAVGYYFRDRGMPLDNMSNTVRIFLGTRLECAQCHNHPFDKWTQMDYFKMASFSYGMNTKSYDSMNRSLATKDLKKGGMEAYREKAIELTGKRNFPYFDKLASLEKYLETVPEVSETQQEVLEPKSAKERKREKKRELRKTDLTVDQHSRLGMSKDEFAEVARQCIAAVEEVAGRRSTMREVLKELYDPLQYTTVSAGDKDASLPHDYQYDDADPKDTISAATMFGAEIDLQPGDSKIEAYADWLTSPDNPTFTRVIVNRLWKEVFGHGIFEPIDELTDQTVISNPGLLAYLEELMVELDYDMRAFQAALYNTRTYQRAAYAGEVELGMAYYFQGPLLRRMTAEQIWDSLVALALPEADRYQPNLEKKLKAIDRIKKIYESLEEKPYDEFMTMVGKIEPLVAAQKADSDSYREKVAEARAADDAAAIRSLRAEYSAGRKQLSRQISRLAYDHLDESVDGGELLLAMGFMDAGSELTAEMGEETAEGEEAPQYIMTSLPKLKGAMNRQNGVRKGELRKMKKRGETPGSGKEDIRIYQKLVSGMARASELDSPAKRGHFLRDFGQSDREVIENASTHASVPQALNLLNGTIVESLTNSYSVFGSRVHEAGDVEEKARMIFQAMLTREPTEKEMELVRAEVNSKGEEAYEGIVWALLNTQQFLFVE